MEVALVLDRFDPLHGGLEHWAFQHATWLSARGHRVHIVASHCAPETAGPHLTLHALGRKRSREEFASAAERRVRELNPDIVHDLGSGWYFDLLQPQFGSRLADARQNLLSLPRPERWFRRFSRAERRRLCQIRAFEARQYGAHGGRIIAVSQMTRADLEHFNQVPSQRIDVIYNGVDPRRFTPPDFTLRTKVREQRNLRDEIVLLFAAHNFRLKGLRTLLEALVFLRTEPVHALIGGRGEIDRYREVARRLGIEKKVTFCGFVDDIRDAYAAADLCVHPTFYDPCSLAVLEALASGLPVITSRFNGAAELMRSGVEGIVLRDPACASELASAIRQLMPHVRGPMRHAARELASRCTADTCFEHILDAYGRVLEMGQGRDTESWKGKL